MAFDGDNIFIGYSREDEALLKEFRTHLKPLAHLGIRPWIDQDIEPGDEWNGEIEEVLRSCRAAVLLSSPDFNASDYVTQRELPLLFRERADRGLLVLPLYLRASNHHLLPEEIRYSRLQGLNDPAKPIAATEGNARDEAWGAVVARLVERLQEPALPVAPDRREAPAPPLPETDVESKKGASRWRRVVAWLALIVALGVGGYLAYQALHPDLPKIEDAQINPLPTTIQPDADDAPTTVGLTAPITEAKDPWDEAAQAIADLERCPQYGGLKLADPDGADRDASPGPFIYPENLHPLGADPASGLWEFALRGTGTIPTRAESGELVRTENFAVVMVLLPGGTFQMGSQSEDANAPNYAATAISNEKPVHQVKLSPFFIGKYEFTKHQWSRLMGGTDESGGSMPVVNLSWDDIQSAMIKVPYALPTEAQWEYACRAGSNTAWCFGDDEATLEEYAWYDKNSDHRVHPVGEKLPNAFGLYDMHGNVWEWCSDWYGEYAANPAGSAANVAADPTGPDTGAYRVLRDGDCWDDAARTRSAYRDRSEPGNRGGFIGFRVAFPARAVRSRP